MVGEAEEETESLGAGGQVDNKRWLQPVVSIFRAPLVVGPMHPTHLLGHRKSVQVNCQKQYLFVLKKNIKY